MDDPEGFTEEQLIERAEAGSVPEASHLRVLPGAYPADPSSVRILAPQSRLETNSRRSAEFLTKDRARAGDDDLRTAPRCARNATSC
jgi:hypothetical protein